MKIPLVILILSLVIISGCGVFQGRYINETDENQTEDQYHLECYDGYCLRVGGAGEDQCSTDIDCTVETHLECIDRKCVEVAGPGTNECTTDSGCRSGGSGGGGGDDPEDPPEEDPKETILTNFGIYPTLSSTEGMIYSANITKELGLNISTTSESWEFRQANATAPLVWNARDRIMNEYAAEANTSIFLRITPWGIDSNGDPNWYCNTTTAHEWSCVILPEYEDEFQIYLDELTQRYTGQMRKIQFGNEWTGSHFVGDEYDYVKYANWLYNYTKKNSPNTTVVLGSITSNPMKYYTHCVLDESDPNYLDHIYFKGGNVPEENITQWCDGFANSFAKFQYALENAQYEMVDIHLYDNPDDWDEYINALRTLTDKPILSTEFGGPSPHIPEKTNETYQAEELRKYINKILELELVEAHFFQLLEAPSAYHNNSGLTKVVSQTPLAAEKKPTFYVYQNRYNTSWNYEGPQLSPLFFSPDKSTVGRSTIISMIIGFIGVLIIIIYLLSIIYNKKFIE